MQSSCLLEFLCCYNHQQKIENNESNDVLVPKHLITGMFFAFIREIIGIMREFLFNEQKCAESEESEAKSQFIEFLALITWLMKSISGDLVKINKNAVFINLCWGISVLDFPTRIMHSLLLMKSSPSRPCLSRCHRMHCQ